MKIDLHVHTSLASSCSNLDLSELLKFSSQFEIDALVLAEHDYQWSESELKKYLKGKNNSLRIFRGVEISCNEGHILVIGASDLKPCIDFKEAHLIIEKAHQLGAVAIAAHPYRYSFQEGEHFKDLDIDAVEIMSVNTDPEAKILARKLAQEKNIPAVAGSDAHCLEEFGTFYTDFFESISCEKDLAKAILAGACQPVVNSKQFCNKGGRRS